MPEVRWEDVKSLADTLYSMLAEKLFCHPISKDRRGRCNPVTLYSFFTQVARMALEAGVEDPIHEIDWEAAIDPELTRAENLKHIQQMISALASKRSASLEDMDAQTLAYIDMEINYIERELEEREKELAPEQREELLKRLRELRAEREEILRRARKRAEAEKPAKVRRVRAAKPKEAERLEKALTSVVSALPPPEKPKPLEEKRFAFETFIKHRAPKVYRFDWIGESLEARVSYHRESEEALMKALKELGAEVKRVSEARPPLRIAYIDFSKASIPRVEVPKVVVPPPPAESEWQKLMSEAEQRVRNWVALYVPRAKQEAILSEFRRLIEEVKTDVLAFLEKGDVASARRIIEQDVLRPVAQTIVSVSRKAREHPEIASLLGAPPPPGAPPPAPAAPRAPPPGEEVSLPPEIAKWAKFLAKLERAMFAPVFHVPPGIPIRPSVPGHPNPLISEFPPIVEESNDKVTLNLTTVGGLARICERHGIEFRPRTTLSKKELLALIESLYRVADEFEREWLDVLRSQLGA